MQELSNQTSISEQNAEATLLLNMARVADSVRLTFRMTPKHISERDHNALLDGQFRICIYTYCIMGILWMGTSLVTYSVFLQNPTEIRVLWVKFSLALNALTAVSIAYVAYAHVRSTLTRGKMELVLIPVVVLGGLVWGLTPTVAGPHSISVVYLCATVLFIFSFLGYFFVFGYWWLGHIYTILLLLGVEIADLTAAGYINIAGLTDLSNSPAYAPPNRFIVPIYSTFYALLMLFLSISLNYVSLLLQASRSLIQNQHDMIKLLLHEFEEGAQDWIWETDQHFRLTYVPTRMLEAATSFQSLMAGKPLMELFKDNRKSSQVLQQSLQKHEGFRNIIVELAGGKNQSFWSLSGRPLFCENHEFQGYRGIGSDVTNEIRSKETEIARQRYDTIISMTGSIAHDFNNLAASIIGSLELVEFTAKHTEREKALIRQAMDSCLRTRDITTQLISFSKLDMALRPVSFLAFTEVNKVINEARPTMSQGISVKIDGDDTRWLYADQTQFSRALLNLVQNANNALCDKFNGGIIHINISVDPHDEQMLMITVSDNGGGIPESVMPRIFDPFYTTRKESGGSGLGLSMAQGFARQSGGDLKVSCHDGVTSFYLILPQGSGQEKFAIEPTETRSGTYEGLRVLVLEDNKHVELVIRKTLQSFGLTVFSAANIDTAKRIFNQHKEKLDFILSDIMLPDGYGSDFIQYVVAENPQLPFIYMSGVSDTLPEDISADLVAPFLQKPFTRDNLMKAIANIM